MFYFQRQNQIKKKVVSEFSSIFYFRMSIDTFVSQFSLPSSFPILSNICGLQFLKYFSDF
jgi:hypothetical protein